MKQKKKLIKNKLKKSFSKSMTIWVFLQAIYLIDHFFRDKKNATLIFFLVLTNCNGDAEQPHIGK